jgi:hypothetical protein
MVFYFIDKSTLFNHVDDFENTLAFSNSNQDDSTEIYLINERKILINWFNINRMQAKSDKFHAKAHKKITNGHLKQF